MLPQDIALYYPYMHIQDDGWLKAAALHWAKIGRVHPVGLRLRDSRVAQELIDTLDFIVDVEPSWHKYDATDTFMTGLVGPHWWIAPLREDEIAARDARLASLRERFPRPPEGVRMPAFPLRVPGGDNRDDVEWIAVDGIPERFDSKAPASFVIAMEAYGLGITYGDGKVIERWQGQHPESLWLGVHPALARLYLTTLVQTIADANGVPVVTDDAGSGDLPGSWTTRLRAREIFEGAEPQKGIGHIRSRYATIALETVVPGDIDRVPVARIVKARQELAPQFAAFRSHLDELTETFSEVEMLGDLKLLSARIEQLANDKILKDVTDLERELRKLRLEPVKKTMQVQTFGLPALASAVLSRLPEYASLSIPAGVAGVSVFLFSAAAQARREAREKRAGAAGYLLGLRNRLGRAG